MVETIAATELAARLAAGDALVLLDVRTARELAICALPGSVHVPLHELAERVDELDRDATIVCVCHHGVRSAGAAAFLDSQGFPRVLNLDGGVDAWAARVDRSMPRY
jgi:rhodanese-related sulfurtransferase